jgi:hypothetical protein
VVAHAGRVAGFKGGNYTTAAACVGGLALGQKILATEIHGKIENVKSKK